MLQFKQATFDCSTFSKRYGKVYFQTTRLDFTALNPKANTWLWDFGNSLRLASERKPAEVNQLHALQKAATALAKSKKVAGIVCKSTNQLTLEDLRALFLELEKSLGSESLSGSSKAQISMHFRQGLLRILPAFGLASHISNITLRFKTGFIRDKKSRGLIDDLQTESPPLGATPHKNVTELKEKISLRVTSTLERIQDGCIKDIEECDRLRQHLLECAELPIDLDLVILVQHALTHHFGESVREKLRLYLDQKPTHLVGALVLCIRANALSVSSNRKRKWEIPFNIEINAYLTAHCGTHIRHAKKIMMCEMAIPEELNMAVLLIQLHTRWNVSSALELDATGVEKVGADYLVQSYKDKVEDETPPVLLAKEHAGAKQAIELLLWNHDQLIQLGIKERHEGRLWWIGRTRRSDGRSEPAHFLIEFCKRHALPRFSAEQLRNQGLFVNSLKTPLDAVRRVAGHAQLGTTGRYLENELGKRLNSSISFEFSKRLQQEVKYHLGMGDKPKWKTMLVPVGDGASCSDPKSPPGGLASGQDHCSASACHVGDGCTNRRIVIDEDRMREVIHTKLMYTASWQRLLANNQEQFTTYHLPAMIFNSALFRVCKTGPHTNTFAKIEREVTEK